MSRSSRASILEAALPRLGLGSSAADVDQWTGVLREEILERIQGAGFDAWSAVAGGVGFCSRPVRLRGHTTRIDAASGEVLASYDSSEAPAGATYVRCNNRRESVCPSCARLYARDTFELVRAGACGGKTVPETVSENPLVFVTLTAPSFGPVHGIRPAGSRCRPRDTGDRCAHGRPVACMAVHRDGDPMVGSPICPDCYDYVGHVLWQWWAPELWRRFTIALRRRVARHLGVVEGRLADVATVQYAKVAEYQVRGIIHFHALVRLDGPRNDGGFSGAPEGLPGHDLARLVHLAARAVAFVAPHPAMALDGGPDRQLGFGRQIDARPVRSTRRSDTDGRALSGEQVAGYLAKYATKSATDLTVTQRRSAHHLRIGTTIDALAADADLVGPYALLGRWRHMLGFRGHFSSKSRRYSVTLGQLRRARRRWQQLVSDSQRSGRPLDVDGLEARLMAEEDDETTLVIRHWRYVGTGWETPGDAALATEAAVRARDDARRAAINRTHPHPEGVAR